MHGQHGQRYLNKDEPNSCFVALFNSHPITIIKTQTVLGTSDDTVLSNPIEHYNLRLTLPGAATDVRVASHADFTWNASLPLFIDYI